mgnify:CR=1 FL=1
MYSNLKKLSNLFIVLSIISGICTVHSLRFLYYDRLILGDETYLFINIYLVIAVPLIFIGLAVALRWIANEFAVYDKIMTQRIKDLENKKSE